MCAHFRDMDCQIDITSDINLHGVLHKKSLIRLDKSTEQDKISNTPPHVKAIEKKQSITDGCFKPDWNLFVSRRTTDSQEILSAGIGRPDKTNDLPQTKLALRIHFVE